MNRFLVLLLLIGCVPASDYVIVNSIKYDIEIVDTVESRSLGLMFRDSLCSTCGMWFEFEESDMQNFWMKNTLLPLDIIFIDENYIVDSVHTAEPCKEDPCEVYSSEGVIRYVLEVNAHSGHKRGDNVDIHRRTG